MTSKLSHIPRLAATAAFIPLFGVMLGVDELSRGAGVKQTLHNVIQELGNDYLFLLGDIIAVCVGEES